MSDAFVTIASAAGAALIGAVVTDAWESTRAGFRRLFGRDEPDRRDQVEAWLDTTEEAITGAAPEERAAVAQRFEQMWTVRIADHLERHPASAEEFRRLAGPAAVATGSVEQRRIKGSAVANTGVIYGSVNIDRRRPR